MALGFSKGILFNISYRVILKMTLHGLALYRYSYHSLVDCSAEGPTSIKVLLLTLGCATHMDRDGFFSSAPCATCYRYLPPAFAQSIGNSFLLKHYSQDSEAALRVTHRDLC
jgi:hypothetical protein